MSKWAKRKAAVVQQNPNEYLIHVYSANGRLLSEYTVNARKHHIADIDGAEEYARDKMSTTRFGAAIVVVSSELADSLEQIHINVAANDSQ